jgi:hypothetical protein
MGCRKNVKSLSAGEKSAFVSAVLGVAAKPSVLHPGDPNHNRYDDFVETHMNAMMAQVGAPSDPSFTPGWAHYGPAFYPWHRIMVLEFEKELQSIIPTVSIPYWDWTDPASSPFTPDFLGGAGTGPDGKVMSVDGPFAHDGPNHWVLHVVDQAGAPDYLQRYLNGADPQNVFPTSLPTAGDVTTVLAQTAYEANPWKGFPSIDSCFRSHMEADLHNWIHNWVGGTMLNMTSPNDPVFWLHHCNIDRLWPIWQAQHPMAAPYLPPAGTVGVTPGHGINDTMIFFSGGPPPWPDTFTPGGSVDQHAFGYWYDTDPPSVLLETPSVAFVDVQQGVGGTSITTYRPIRFACESCGDVTLAIKAGPTAGFGAPQPLETVHPNHDPTMGLSPSEGALWISYASATPGSSIMGSVTVQATDVNTGTVFGPWPVNLSANTVARQASATTLVLDRSGSMSLDAGNGHQRVELLRTAVSTFIDLMQQGDGLSIVRFDNLVDTLMPVTDVGPMGGAGRLQAQAIVASHDPATTLDPRGSTSIGGGIVAGKATLDAVAGSYQQRAMIVLTDGLENTPPMIAQVGSSLNDHTFAIGFGQAAAISTAALNQITQNHDGYLIVTGPISQEENFALTEYFLKIQAGINNSTAVLDPRGELVFGVTHRIPFVLTTADHGVDVVLLSPAPYYIDFRLQTPDGRIIDPAHAATQPAIQYVATSRVSYYRASLPMLAKDPNGSHRGVWHVLLGLSDRAKDGDRQLIASLRRAALPYSLLVHAYSDLSFRPSVRQTDFEPGATVNVAVALDQFGVPLQAPATAWAEITRPDGTTTTAMLSRTAPGRFSSSFSANAIGVYTVFVHAKGVTMDGEHFAREQRLTAVAFLGGNQSADPGVDPLCQLIDCLTKSGAISAATKETLAAQGIDLRKLLACAEQHCRSSQGALGGETPYEPGAAATLSTTGLTTNDVRAVMLALQQQSAGAPSQFAQLITGESRPTPPPSRPVPLTSRPRPFGRDPGAPPLPKPR